MLIEQVKFFNFYIKRNLEKFKPVYKNGANRYWLNGNHIQILKYFIFNHVNRNVDNLMSEIMSYTTMNRELKSDKVKRSVLFLYLVLYSS